ncbi:hypothetical protein SAMN05216359_101664 [Roseateles sp. YR242]|uniref:hypothetical protein n=1 Tax=Roseateles sp. YR242 TaxID=1855305 RepID=UPI0008D5630A|nr:hypothetical protein [Roseateles sp. YR242]SEK39091.1 hypothetical protein SAMN05216359_101664 [Roseateles sp. YR242]
MNEPELNHLSRIEIPQLPAQLLLVLSSLLLSLMLAGAAFGFTDQNADLRSQRQDQQEQGRLAQQRLRASDPAASTVVVARADAGSASRGPQARKADQIKKEQAR